MDETGELGAPNLSNSGTAVDHCLTGNGEMVQVNGATVSGSHGHACWFGRRPSVSLAGAFRWVCY